MGIYRKSEMKAKRSTPVEIYEKRASQPDYCRLEEVSTAFILSLVMLEDWEFFQHKGLSFRETRWAVRQALHGRSNYGGSTITQQLVKNLYFRFDPSIRRKIKEAFLARRFERALSKQQILELYMNVIYYDNGQYGLSDASRFYFHKSPKELTLNQSVFLSALLPVVGICNPLYHPKEFVRCRDRKLTFQKEYFTEELLAEITRHGEDCLDEELCKASEETKRYDAPGPMINERFGPGGPDCLIE